MCTNDGKVFSWGKGDRGCLGENSLTILQWESVRLIAQIRTLRFRYNWSILFGWFYNYINIRKTLPSKNLRTSNWSWFQDKVIRMEEKSPNRFSPYPLRRSCTWAQRTVTPHSSAVTERCTCVGPDPRDNSARGATLMLFNQLLSMSLNQQKWCEISSLLLFFVYFLICNSLESIWEIGISNKLSSSWNHVLLVNLSNSIVYQLLFSNRHVAEGMRTTLSHWY